MESPGQAAEEARSDFAPEHDRRLLAGELWASPEPQCPVPVGAGAGAARAAARCKD